MTVVLITFDNFKKKVFPKMAQPSKTYTEEDYQKKANNLSDKLSEKTEF